MLSTVAGTGGTTPFFVIVIKEANDKMSHLMGGGYRLPMRNQPLRALITRILKNPL